jgi:lipopolysaccharide heptosyltransferase II
LATRIVVRAPNWLGDVVLSLPAVRDLRRNLPGVGVTMLARAPVAELYRAVPEVDEVVISRGVRADAAALRGRHDLGILLPNSFGSALALALARVPERWGWSTDGRGLLLTRAAPVPARLRGQNQLYYYRAMLAAMGLDVTPPPQTALSCPPEWDARASELLDHRDAGGWIGVSPGAHFGSAKRWLPERFAAVAQRLAAGSGAGVAVLGAASERALTAQVAAQVKAPVADLGGRTTLSELVGVLGRLRLLITNDSGAMHVAAALGTPVVAVIGPTDARETAPVGGAHRLVREPVHCSPCLLRECPIDHRCMRRVTVSRVVDEARGLLAAPPNA